VGDAVFTDRNQVRRHTSAVPAMGQSVLVRDLARKIMGYEESNVGAWRYGAAAVAVVGP
jgi:hypothetical protein